MGHRYNSGLVNFHVKQAKAIELAQTQKNMTKIYILFSTALLYSSIVLDTDVLMMVTTE